MKKLIKIHDDEYVIIDDIELTEGVEGNYYFNIYDNKIWKYKPSPCPLPYWGNIATLRKITHCTYFLNDDIETITFIKYL